MTKLLEQALDRVRQLPAAEQDVVASLVLDELESTQLWENRLEQTSDKLESLAQRALENDQRGESVEKGWDEL